MLIRSQRSARRIGTAKGKFKVPRDIDADNATIAKIFKGKMR